MTPEFLAAVIDALLPGDEVLPSGTAAGLNLNNHAAAHRQLLEAVAAATFVHGDAGTRMRVLQSVEQRMPDAFRSFVTAVLADYYESATVLAALGWPAAPPQPAGHGPAGMDEGTRAALRRVAGRGRLWRA